MRYWERHRNVERVLHSFSAHMLAQADVSRMYSAGVSYRGRTSLEPQSFAEAPRCIPYAPLGLAMPSFQHIIDGDFKREVAIKAQKGQVLIRYDTVLISSTPTFTARTWETLARPP